MSSLTVYLGTDDKGISLDTPLGTVGDRGTVTIESETCAVIYGFGTTYLFVERGNNGTTAAPHAIGTTVTASIGSLNPTPTLAEVLAEGNDPENQTISAAATVDRVTPAALAVYGDQGAGQATLTGASTRQSGAAIGAGDVNLTAGNGWNGAAPTSGAGLALAGGYDDGPGDAILTAPGHLELNLGGITGFITVQSPTPTTTYITPLVLADAGLYAWTGAAYTKIGDTPS